MTPRTRIGDLVDHDMKLYGFARDSKLPRGTFDDDPWVTWGDIFVVVVSVVGYLVALLLGWGGQ